MDTCKRCGKKFEGFLTKKEKPSTKCQKCLDEKNRQNKERHHRIMRDYYSANRQKYKEMRFRNALKRKYGITTEDYEAIWKSQKGLCAICGIAMIRLSVFGKPNKTMPCIDHDHKTGRVRGILCRGCNLRLEIIDNNNFLLKANQYLSKF